MRHWGLAGLMLPLLVGGCIPPAAPPPSAASADPYIAPRYEDLIEEKPVWEMRPVTADAKTVTGATYTVEPGDTLSAIGVKTGAGTEAIARANGLVPPYFLKVGQSLSIPSGRYHSVSAGETGIAIARAYGISWSSLIALNQLEEPFVLKVGQRLKLPDNSAPAPGQSMEARAAAFRIEIDDILTGGEPAGDVATSERSVPPTPTAPLSPAIAVKEPTSFTSGFGWPVAGRLVDRFGPAGTGRVNQGIEIVTAAAAPVKASGDGVVAFVGDQLAGYGGLIMIRHGNSWISAYGRIATSTVTRGQSVKRGDIIGETGRGSAPQLHFELRKSRVPVDPLKQLPPR